MPLSTIALENYRCFSRRQTIQIRPLTILLGRNNAGKSAVARFPLLAATGVIGASTAPLELDESGVFANSFVELIHGRRPHGSIGVGLGFDVAGFGPVAFDATIQNVSEARLQLVSSLQLTADDVTFSLDWTQAEPHAGVNKYRSRAGTSNTTVEFRGLLPSAVTSGMVDGNEDDHWRFAAAVDNARQDFDALRYLGPFRAEPKRYYRLPPRVPDEVGRLGENAPAMLAADQIHGGGELLAKVNEFLASVATGQWQIGVESAGFEDLHSIVLSSLADPERTEINLADTGTGIAQALPLLVQRAKDILSPPQHPTLEIIEQPELHLHPSAHADLADLYVGGLAESHSRFMIETHSETFVLRVRRRVAEGLDPDLIGLYFVDNDGAAARIDRIHLDPLGNVDYWPEGVFTEDYDETRALVNAQLASHGRADPN